MKRLVQGSIIKIPLRHKLGYVYAKYLDLTKIDSNSMLPDAVIVYDKFSKEETLSLEELKESRYLICPMLVAGLRPTIKKGLWEIIDRDSLTSFESRMPNFKSGCETYDDLEKDKWFLIENGKKSNKTETDFESVKYLQSYTAFGTGTLELRLSMYVLMFKGLKVEDYFDMNDESVKWSYVQISCSPLWPADMQINIWTNPSTR